MLVWGNLIFSIFRWLPYAHLHRWGSKDSNASLVQHVFGGKNNFVTAFRLRKLLNQIHVPPRPLVAFLSLLFKSDSSALLCLNTWWSWAMDLISFKMCTNTLLRYHLRRLLSLLKQLSWRRDPPATLDGQEKNNVFMVFGSVARCLALVTTMQIAPILKYATSN